MSGVVTGPMIWPALQELIPDLPDGTITLDLRVATDEIVTVRVEYHPHVGGQAKVAAGGFELERITERFALIPYGETRPPSEREALIAELIRLARLIERVQEIAEATSTRFMMGDRPNESLQILLSGAADDADRLIRKHEGKA